MDDAACVKVNDNSLVDMPLSGGELINPYAAYTLYVRTGVFVFQILLVDALYHVPAHMQVSGNVQDGVAHSQQVKHIAGEPVGVAYLSVSKRNVGLPCLLTLLAPIALYPKGQVAGFAAERKIVDVTKNRTISYNMAAATMRAYMLLGQDCFEIEENCIIFVLCTAIRIVLDSVGLI
jgi:hypothetical protein